MTRSILETAAAIIGSLDMEERRIIYKLGHRIGEVVTVEATTPPGKFGSKLRSMEVILGERSKGMKETKFLATSFNLRDLRFGGKGSLNA